MAELPTGTVTLFSDVEGSTALLSRLGSAYADALDGQRRVLRSFADVVRTLRIAAGSRHDDRRPFRRLWDDVGVRVPYWPHIGPGSGLGP